jgi:adenosylcobinamide-GDP ribazoletransferase
MTPLRLALQFLTRLPVSSVTPDGVGLQRAPLCFPLVGAVLGALLWLAHLLLEPWLPVAVERTLLVVLSVGLSGALHLDGLSDTVDGLVGGRDRESTLRIMQDPHAGSMGTAAVLCTLLLRHSALVALPAAAVGASVLAACVCSRSVLLGALLLRPARAEGFAHAFAQPRDGARLAVLAAGVAAAPLALLGARGWIAAGAAALAGAWVLRAGVRRLGGVTGDVCGAAGEVAETAFLVAAAGALRA